MGISATTAGYTNTGHDIQLVLVDQQGVKINLENVMQFDSRQETANLKRVRLDNRVLVARLPQSWTGTITYDRGSGSIDEAIAKIEDNWFQGNDLQLGSLELTIAPKVPAPGAPAALKIRFVDVTVSQEDAGQWRGDDATSCRLTFEAARRAVGGLGNFNATLNEFA